MTDQELKDLVASLAIESKKTDEQLKKTDEQLEKLTKKIDSIGTLVGSIANNQGSVAEEYFIKSLEDKLQIGSLKFDYLISNYMIKSKKFRDKFDILLVNGESVAIIEVKYKVHPNDVDKLDNKIKHLKSLPQYKNYKVYAGIAGFSIPEESIQKALLKGYFILQRKGDIVETITDNMRAA